MKHFFVIGNNTSKSLSPLIFNHWFKKYKINAKYTYVEIKKEKLDKFILEKIHEGKTTGFNITIPFKKDIIKYLENENKHVKKIGAANCVTINKKIQGSNTDWIGFLNIIKDHNIKKNNKIIILGYGGAAQAIVYGFLLKGYKNVIIFNRSKRKINNTKNYTKKYSLIGQHLKNADIVINTTPANPLNKKQTKLLNQKALVADIVYKPKNTKFLEQFKKNPKIYGISMLIEQAIPCFKTWFGFEPKLDDSLKKKLNKKIL